MERTQVIACIESLANGMDPANGGPLTEEAFRATEVIQALNDAARFLRDEHATKLALARPPAAGTRWTDEEDARLGSEYDGGMPVREIARQHGRSIAAIELRLVHLGRMEPTSVPVRSRGTRMAS
jgi:hypothetical protein